MWEPVLARLEPVLPVWEVVPPEIAPAGSGQGSEQESGQVFERQDGSRRRVVARPARGEMAKGLGPVLSVQRQAAQPAEIVQVPGMQVLERAVALPAPAAQRV